MSRALALVGLVCFSATARAAMVHIEPAVPEAWIKVTTSQTPPNAFPIYYRTPEFTPIFISEFPILWRFRPLTHNVPLLEFRLGALILPVRLNASESPLSEVAVNFATEGNQFLVTLTSAVGARQFYSQPFGAPEPSGLALALCGVLGLRRHGFASFGLASTNRTVPSRSMPS